MILPGKPFPLGAHLTPEGTNFAIFSEVATEVELCLFDDTGRESRITLPEKTAAVWHAFVPGVTAGQRYGFRVHGPWDPAAGHRCNAAKLLVDPNAKAIDGDVSWDEAVFGHHFGDPYTANDVDSAPFVPKSVVIDPSFDWGTDQPLSVSLDDTIVYETHVKGLTMTHPDVPKDQRGTYAGLAHPSVVQYLKDLGVTAVELLPVHHFVQDSHLLDKGLRNYWGYNSIGFLAPYSGYSASGSAGEQVAEFKHMVKTLHEAGLEVILDVVYNHTAEGNHLGPTLSFKGIDNHAFYRLVDDQPESYFDTTGTGNSWNVSHPAALQQIMDSLRYWVTDMHIDGFRFDLATTLTRQSGDVSQHSAFLAMVHQDPVLAGVKLIAEPWDVGEDGYQVGGFPARWSEWNGKYRDSIRDFWRGETDGMGEFALRLTGSPDIYGLDGRGPTASVNFITAHDGFTLADLTAYNEKHNDENGEDNNDGDSHNRSWNCGVEGLTDHPPIVELRLQQRRNMLTTLLLSHGVPMLLGGDEIGRSQSGNNNAYCQDNEVSWYDWQNVDKELLEFTKSIIDFRRSHPALRRRWYAEGETGQGLRRAELVMFRSDGAVMEDDDWNDDHSKSLMICINGTQLSEPEEDGNIPNDSRLLILVNTHHEGVEFTLPPKNFCKQWTVAITTAGNQDVSRSGGEKLIVDPRSLLVLEAL
jgi:isoamylase